MFAFGVPRKSWIFDAPKQLISMSPAVLEFPLPSVIFRGFPPDLRVEVKGKEGLLSGSSHSKHSETGSRRKACRPLGGNRPEKKTFRNETPCRGRLLPQNPKRTISRGQPLNLRASCSTRATGRGSKLLIKGRRIEEPYKGPTRPCTRSFDHGPYSTASSACCVRAYRIGQPQNPEPEAQRHPLQCFGDLGVALGGAVDMGELRVA